MFTAGRCAGAGTCRSYARLSPALATHVAQIRCGGQRGVAGAGAAVVLRPCGRSPAAACTPPCQVDGKTVAQEEEELRKAAEARAAKEARSLEVKRAAKAAKAEEERSKWWDFARAQFGPRADDDAAAEGKVVKARKTGAGWRVGCGSVWGGAGAGWSWAGWG
jgi:hypothetical protein